MANLIKQ